MKTKQSQTNTLKIDIENGIKLKREEKCRKFVSFAFSKVKEFYFHHEIKLSLLILLLSCGILYPTITCVIDSLNNKTAYSFITYFTSALLLFAIIMMASIVLIRLVKLCMDWTKYTITHDCMGELLDSLPNEYLEIPQPLPLHNE